LYDEDEEESNNNPNSQNTQGSQSGDIIHTGGDTGDHIEIHKEEDDSTFTIVNYEENVDGKLSRSSEFNNIIEGRIDKVFSTPELQKDDSFHGSQTYFFNGSQEDLNRSNSQNLNDSAALERLSSNLSQSSLEIHTNNILKGQEPEKNK